MQMQIPTEYTVCDPDYHGGSSDLEDIGLLRDFVRTVKSLESEHQICLTSLNAEEKASFAEMCKPLTDYLKLLYGAE